MTLRSLLFLCIVVAIPRTVAAQDAVGASDTAFSTLRFSLSGGLVFRDRGMTAWDPGPSARFAVDTPYGIGKLRADVSWQVWTGGPEQTLIDTEGLRSTGALPDVQTLAVVAGWGWDTDPASPVSVEAGWMLGNLFMLFDLPSSEPARFESEILTGPWVRVNRRLGALQVFAEVRAHRVLTRPRWDVLSPSAGLAVDTKTPEWMKWVLR